MTKLKWLVGSLFFAAGPAMANTFLSDLSDLWWNANESGWGVTVTHQREIVFLTFFIYGQDGRASWYTAQAVYGGRDSSGAYLFSGSMYRVSGSWFGTLFNPAIVSPQAVGSMSFTVPSLNAANLVYSIDGVTVTKALTRQTFRNNDLTGEYVGAIKQTQTGCRSPYVNGDFNPESSLSNASRSFQRAEIPRNQSNVR